MVELSKGLRNSESVTVFGGNSNVVEMKIHADASAHIISRLTNLYTDPISSLVRELIQNARDAIAAAGKSSAPVVTLPDSVSMSFSVSDDGVGMSRVKLEEIFATYGGSDKVNDFDQVGGYGLGAKSPFAYTDNFEVVSCSDGVTTVMKAFMNNSVPSYVVETVSTPDKPNGTTVTVPVKPADASKFRGAAFEHYLYGSLAPLTIFDAGNELNDGSRYSHVFDFDMDGVKLGLYFDTHTIVKRRVSERVARADFVVGSYCYLRSDVKRWNTFIVSVPAGVLDFTSSRDNIVKNDRYDALVNFLNDAADKFGDRIDSEIFRHILKTGKVDSVRDIFREVKLSDDGSGVILPDGSLLLFEDMPDDNVKEILDRRFFATLLKYGKSFHSNSSSFSKKIVDIAQEALDNFSSGRAELSIGLVAEELRFYDLNKVYFVQISNENELRELYTKTRKNMVGDGNYAIVTVRDKDSFKIEELRSHRVTIPASSFWVGTYQDLVNHFKGIKSKRNDFKGFLTVGNGKVVDISSFYSLLSLNEKDLSLSDNGVYFDDIDFSDDVTPVFYVFAGVLNLSSMVASLGNFIERFEDKARLKNVVLYAVKKPLKKTFDSMVERFHVVVDRDFECFSSAKDLAIRSKKFGLIDLIDRLPADQRDSVFLKISGRRYYYSMDRLEWFANNFVVNGLDEAVVSCVDFYSEYANDKKTVLRAVSSSLCFRMLPEYDSKVDTVLAISKAVDNSGVLEFVSNISLSDTALLEVGTKLLDLAFGGPENHDYQVSLRR